MKINYDVKKIKKIIFALIICITLLYLYPYQRYQADKGITQFNIEHGLDKYTIKDKKFFKAYSQANYFITVEFIEEPDKTYIYEYYTRKQNIRNKIECGIYNETERIKKLY